MPTLQPQAFRKVFSVADYGATGIDDGTDDTQFINDALAAIVAYDTSIGHGYPAGGALVPYIYILYFPTGIYRISSTIEMGGSLQGLKISGDGAIIKPIDGALFQDAAGQDICAFKHDNCYNVTVEGIDFVNFKKALGLYLPGDLESGMVKVSNCKFQGNTELSLELACNSGMFLVEGCKFFNNKQDINILGGNQIVIRDCWIHPADGLDGDHPCVINNSGRLLIEDCTLVPSQQSNDSIEPAWINNYGSVIAKNTRQGGETGGFCLVNNFVGVGDLNATSSIIVKDCLCYSAWNDEASNLENYFTPTVVRYINAIPNLTVIEDNIGMKSARIMGFSKVLYNDDDATIESVIQASGPSNFINSSYVSVKVSNNIGGIGWGGSAGGSSIPYPLHKFVRDKADLWPYKPAISLERLNPPNPNNPDDTTGLVDSNGTRIFKFEYPIDNNIDTALLVNFSGCILGAGSSAYYRGGFVGIIKANGVWNNNSFQKALIMETLFNQIGEANSFPNGSFGVDVYWDESSTGGSSSIFLPDGSTNRDFYIRIAGLQGYDVTNVITVTPIDTFMLGQF